MNAELKTSLELVIESSVSGDDSTTTDRLKSYVQQKTRNILEKKYEIDDEPIDFSDEDDVDDNKDEEDFPEDMDGEGNTKPSFRKNNPFFKK